MNVLCIHAVHCRRHSGYELAQTEQLENDMWCGASFCTLLAALLTVLFLAPLSLGWRGVIDCVKRCHLAHTTGAHCPLRYHRDSQTKPSTPHCPMHDTATRLANFFRLASPVVPQWSGKYLAEDIFLGCL